MTGSNIYIKAQSEPNRPDTTKLFEAQNKPREADSLCNVTAPRCKPRQPRDPAIVPFCPGRMVPGLHIMRSKRQLSLARGEHSPGRDRRAWPARSGEGHPNRRVKRKSRVSNPLFQYYTFFNNKILTLS